MAIKKIPRNKIPIQFQRERKNRSILVIEKKDTNKVLYPFYIGKWQGEGEEQPEIITKQEFFWVINESTNIDATLIPLPEVEVIWEKSIDRPNWDIQFSGRFLDDSTYTVTYYGGEIKVDQDDNLIFTEVFPDAEDETENGILGIKYFFATRIEKHILPNGEVYAYTFTLQRLETGLVNNSSGDPITINYFLTPVQPTNFKYVQIEFIDPCVTLVQRINLFNEAGKITGIKLLRDEQSKQRLLIDDNNQLQYNNDDEDIYTVYPNVGNSFQNRSWWAESIAYQNAMAKYVESIAIDVELGPPPDFSPIFKKLVWTRDNGSGVIFPREPMDDTTYWAFDVNQLLAQNTGELVKEIDKASAPIGLSVGKFLNYDQDLIGQQDPPYLSARNITKTYNTFLRVFALADRVWISEIVPNEKYYKNPNPTNPANYFDDIDFILFEEGYVSPDGITFGEDIPDEVVEGINKSSDEMNDWSNSSAADRSFITIGKGTIFDFATWKSPSNYPTKVIDLGGIPSRTTTFITSAGVTIGHSNNDFDIVANVPEQFRGGVYTLEMPTTIGALERIDIKAFSRSKYKITFYDENLNIVTTHTKTTIGGRGQLNRNKTLTSTSYV